MKLWIVTAGLLAALLAGCGDDGDRNHAPTIDDLRVTFAGPVSWSVQLLARDTDGDALTWSLAVGQRADGPFAPVGEGRGPLITGQAATLSFDDEGQPLAYLRVEVSDIKGGRAAHVVQLVGDTYLYYWDATAQRLRTYSVDEDACALTLVDTEDGPRYAGDGALGADPRGRFVYLGDAYAHGLRSYTVDPRDGTLGPPVSSSFGGSRLPAPGPLAATGSHLFMASTPWGCCADGSLHGFVLDAASGALRELPSFCRLADPSFVAVDTSGRHLYTGGLESNHASPSIEAYELRDDGSMGAVFAESLSAESGAGVQGGDVLFVAVGGRLRMWRIDGVSGRLTPVGVALPVASLVATDPLGRSLALLGEELSLYTVERPSLALRLEDSVPVTGVRYRSRLALSVSTRLVMFDNGAGDLRLFRRNARDGRLEACSAPAGGYDPGAPRENEFLFMRIGRAEPR